MLRSHKTYHVCTNASRSIYCHLEMMTVTRKIVRFFEIESFLNMLEDKFVVCDEPVQR